MPPFRASIVAIALACPACTMSAVDPNAQVQLSGTTLAASGAPLANQKIALVKEPDLGEVLGGILLGPVTVLACLSDDPPAICQEALVNRSDSSGAFSFTLLGSDTQGSFGNASFFNATTAMPAESAQIDGAGSSLRFQVLRETMRLPAMRMWQGEVRVSNDAQSLRMSSAEQGAGSVSLRVEEYGAWSVPLWQVEEYQGGPVDARVLEDRSAAAVLVAQERVYAEGIAFESTRRSPSYPVDGLAGAPPSRAAACAISDSAGNLQTQEPCLLSDGDLTTPLPSPVQAECQQEACGESLAHREAVLDLGTLRAASLLVVRLGYNPAQLAISEDGENWQGIGVPLTGHHAINLEVGTRLRYLRVQGDDFEDSLAGLSELSVW